MIPKRAIQCAVRNRWLPDSVNVAAVDREFWKAIVPNINDKEFWPFVAKEWFDKHLRGDDMTDFWTELLGEKSGPNLS